LDPTPTQPAANIDRRNVEERRQTTARTLIGTVIVITILYTGRQVVIPIALAILFAFLLTPAVRFLERSFLGRRGSVAIVLALTLTILSLGGWALALQANSLARQVARYSGNLEKKLEFLKKGSIGSFSIVERTLERLSKTAETAIERPDMKVQVLPDQKPLPERWKRVAPAIEFIASSFLVIFLVYFLLMDREKLRDKLLRIAGRAHLTVTTQAIGETTHRISRYLVAFALLNVGYGILICIGLFLLGVPQWLLWGVLAALLRFIPYIGAILSGALPFLMAAAVFPGWYVALAVLALFVIIDQFLGGFIEPAVIGHRVGVSPIALLVSTIFWGWLWGPVGLLLATPITVCLTVGGEFIPALRIFSILFGTDVPLEDYLSFYNRLLLRDRAGAAGVADRFAEESSMEDTFNEIFTPTLTFANEELQRKRITRAHDHFIKDTIRELIIRLGDRNAEIDPEGPRMIAASVGGERLSLGTLMLSQLARSTGWSVDMFTDLEPIELREFAAETRPALIAISCSNVNRLSDGYELLKTVRDGHPDVRILATGSAFAQNEREAKAAGASVVPTSLEQGFAEIGRMRRHR
jgi:predicted PurR-regulated permease PerM